MARTKRVDYDRDGEADREDEGVKNATSPAVPRARRREVKCIVERVPEGAIIKILVSKQSYKIRVLDGPQLPNFDEYMSGIEEYFDRNFDKQLMAACGELFEEAIFVAAREAFGVLMTSQAEAVKRGEMSRRRVDKFILERVSQRGRPRSWSQFELARALKEAAAGLERVTWPALAAAVNRANPGRAETDQTLRRHAAELLNWKIGDVRASKHVGK